MTNSEISNNTSEDGLNIKDSKVFISKSNFFDNFVDQVDFDNVSEGVIKIGFLLAASSIMVTALI